jgi:hypothetical protein
VPEAFDGGLGCCRARGSCLPADFVSRACLREWISRGRSLRLILHADNGNAMSAATLECKLEELSVLRPSNRPRVSIDNPYSGSLLSSAIYRPDYLNWTFTSAETACQRVTAFVDWYNLPALLQRHKVRYCPPAPLWRSRGDLSSPCCRLRGGTPADPTQLVAISALLASTGGGMNQPTTSNNRIRKTCICHCFLKSSRGVISPGSYCIEVAMHGCVRSGSIGSATTLSGLASACELKKVV